MTQPSDKDFDTSDQAQKPADTNAGPSLLDRVENAFTPSPAPARDTSTPSTPSSRPSEIDRINEQLQGGDRPGDTPSLTDSHPGVNMPLDKMSTSQARSISDTQLQAQGVGGASQVSFRDRNGNVETLTKSVENGATRYYRPDGTYLEPVKHSDGSDRYEMRDSRNPTEVVRMKELPTVTAASSSDRPPTSTQQPADRPPAGGTQTPAGDRLPPPSAPVVKGGDSVAVPGQSPAGHGTDSTAAASTIRVGDKDLTPVPHSGNANGSAESYLYKDSNNNFYRIDMGPHGVPRSATSVDAQTAEQHIQRAAPNSPDVPRLRPDAVTANPAQPVRPADAPNPAPNPAQPGQPPRPGDAGPAGQGQGQPPRPGDAGPAGQGQPPRPGDAGPAGQGQGPRPGDAGPAGQGQGPRPGDAGPAGQGQGPRPGDAGPAGQGQGPRPGDAGPAGPGRRDDDPGRFGRGGDPGTQRTDPGRVADGGVRAPGQPGGGPGAGGDAGIVRPGRDVGISSGPIDPTGRVVRDAAVLAQDLRAAEQKFRGSDTQDARADARRDLEALRREYADAVRQDPTYGARVQDAYRTLEGRGGAGGAGGDKGPLAGPRTTDGIPAGAPVPARPGRDGADQAGEVAKEAAKQARDARDAGPSPSEVLRLAGINLADQRTRDSMLDILKKMDGGNLKPDQLDANNRKMFEALKGLEPGRMEQLKQYLTDLQTPGKQRPDDATIALKIKEIMDGGKETTLAKRADATDLSGAPKTASERLLDFMKTNKELVGQGTDSERSRAAMLELNKIVRDLNKEMGLDPTKGMTVKDILARGLEGTAARPGEKAVLERTQTSKEETYVAKLNPSQEAAFKAMTERGTRPETTTVAEKRVEATQAATEKRPEGPRPEAGKMETGREPGKADAPRSEAATQVPQKGGQPEGRSGPDGKMADGKAEPGAKDLGVKPDAAAIRGVEAAAAAAAGTKAAADAGPQNIDPRAAQGRSDLTDKLEEDKKHKKEDEKERLEEEQKRLTDAQLAVLAARKAKEDKEREEKEKEKAQESDKKEQDARRTKYVVKEKDTLESIAVRMLRDKRLAALILEINKTVIQVREENGKKVVDLQPKLVIWLPSPLDIRDFRGRVFGAAGEQIEYGQASTSTQPYTGEPMTPEEELAAKFGGRPEDYADGKAALAGRTESADAADDAIAEMTAEAVAAAKTRRENVEKLLGPVAAPKNVDDTGNLKYTVRLGDTLKSVAIKHPALQDVQLWKLLAETNGLSTDTDAKGTPTAQLKRGTVIKVPPPHVVEEYRKEHKLKAIVPKASVEPSSGTVKFDVATKPCSECGRMTTQDADICPGCGHSFVKTSVNLAAALKPPTPPAPQPPMMPQPVQAVTPPQPAVPQQPAAQAPAAQAPAAQAPQTPAQKTAGAPVPPKPVPKAPSMPGPLPRPGTVFDASPNAPAESGKSAGRPGPPPPIPRRKSTEDLPSQGGAAFYPEPDKLAPAPKPEPQPVPERQPPALPPSLGPSVDEDDFTRQLFGGMGFEPVPQPAAAPPKPKLAEREVQGFIQQLGDACRLVKSGAPAGAKAGSKSHLEVRRPDQTWVPILTYEIYEDVSLRHEFTLDGRRKTIRIDLPPQAVQELADNDLTTNWQNYCQRFLSGRTISD